MQVYISMANSVICVQNIIVMDTDYLSCPIARNNKICNLYNRKVRNGNLF